MTLDNNVTFLENVQGGAAVARLLEEIGEVYKTACHCGCGVDGVLTQVELIDALISRGAVPESARIVVPEREEPPIWMIRELDGPNRSRCVHAIRHEGVEYLSELRDWTFVRLRPDSHHRADFGAGNRIGDGEAWTVSARCRSSRGRRRGRGRGRRGRHARGGGRGGYVIA